MDETKKRDYKAEYKKFQSSTKAKKYRAELNKYNRKKGTYGNGDGKDASHKGGKIVGFEAQSKNRGRAEKSRLKKETVMSKKIYEVKIGKYDIGMGYKGNGLTIWNRNVEKAGDYKNIAHIDNNGKITNYEKRQPKEVTAFIQKTAQAMKDKPKGESVNESINEEKVKKLSVYMPKKTTKELPQIKKFVQRFVPNAKFDMKGNVLHIDGGGKSMKRLSQLIYNEFYVDKVMWNESINEFKNMSPGLKKALAQKGYGPLFFTIDQSKRQLKQMKYTKGEIEDTLFTMFGDQDPKIVKKIKESKIKESINEKKGAWFNSLFPKSKVQKAIEIAKEMGGNMTGATKKIEKFFPGMILNTDVQDALRKYNESINEQEMSIKDAFKDLVKDHGAKKALDMLADVLTGGALASMDDKKIKAFKKKLLKKVTTESANKVIEGLGDRISKISKKYAKGQKKSKKALKNKKGPYQEEINENSKVYSVDVDDMVDILSSWDKYADGNIFMGKNLHGKKPEPFATKYGQQSGGKKDALKALVKRWKKLDVKPQTTIKIFNAYHKLPDSKKMFSNPDFWEDFLEKNGITVVSESINETPYELGGMKVYSKADGLKKVKSMQKTDGAKIYKVTKTKTKLYDKYPVTMYNLHTKNKNHSTNSNPYGLDMMKGVYLIPVKESVNEDVWTAKITKAVKQIDKDWYKLIAKKGIEPYSHEASRLWRSAGFYDRMRKAFGKDKSVNERMDKRQAAETLKQLGGNKFIMMTGAKNFAFGSNGLSFKIGRNAKAVNYVVIDLNGKDLYDMKFQKGTRVLNKVNDVYNDQLQKMFTKYTGMYTSLGTMGR